MTRTLEDFQRAVNFYSVLVSVRPPTVRFGTLHGEAHARAFRTNVIVFDPSKCESYSEQELTRLVIHELCHFKPFGMFHWGPWKYYFSRHLKLVRDG